MDPSCWYRTSVISPIQTDQIEFPSNKLFRACITGAMGGIPGERPFNLLLPGLLQPNFIDPLAKQRHRKAFAVAGGDSLFLMA